MRSFILTAALLIAALYPYQGHAADDLDLRLKKLESEMTRQTGTIETQQNTINSLKEELNRSKPKDDLAIQPAKPVEGKSSGLFGGSLMSNPYISVILDAKGYVSNLKNSQLAERGIPGFASEGSGLRNGFNVDAAELMIFAPVDPYFNLYTNIPVTKDGAELEEAYFITTSLPAGLQVKGGRFKSNASRLNAQHPHAWNFAELPLAYRSFLGAEALGGENGVQLTWLPSLPVYTLFGVEVLQGDNPLLFGDNSNWGPHAYTAFARLSFDTTDNSTFYISPWVMFGKTKSSAILPADQTTGNSFELKGDSSLYGIEAVWKWKSGKHKLTLQGEYLNLAQKGDLTENDTAGAAVNTEPLKRRQDGAYVQAVYHLDRLGIGARYDRMELFTDTFERSGAQQSFGSKPWRLSAMTEYELSEFSRIRFQFNHDRSARDGRVNNEGILQFTFTIGAHGAHAF